MTDGFHHLTTSAVYDFKCYMIISQNYNNNPKYRFAFGVLCRFCVKAAQCKSRKIPSKGLSYYKHGENSTCFIKRMKLFLTSAVLQTKHPQIITYRSTKETDYLIYQPFIQS